MFVFLMDIEMGRYKHSIGTQESWLELLYFLIISDQIGEVHSLFWNVLSTGSVGLVLSTNWDLGVHNYSYQIVANA